MLVKRPCESSSARACAVAVSLLCASLGGCVGNGFGLDREGRPIVPDLAPVVDSGSSTALGQLQRSIFDAYCTGCHSGAIAPKGLQLDEGNAYKFLVGVAATEVPELKRVVPGNADDSYLMIKIIPTDPRRVQARMPRNGPPYLSDAEIAMVRGWIEQGAPGQ